MCVHCDVMVHVIDGLLTGCLFVCLHRRERVEGSGGKSAKTKWIAKPSWAKKRECSVTKLGCPGKQCHYSPWQR